MRFVMMSIASGPGADRHVHGAARREHRAGSPAARPPSHAVPRRDRHHHEPHRAGSARRAVPHRLRRGQQGRGDPRLHQWNGDLMVTRSFNTADRGVQGVRGVAGARDRVTELDMRYRLDVVAPTVLDAVSFAGGWGYDPVMAGWDVTVLISGDDDARALEILGAEGRDLESVLEA